MPSNDSGDPFHIHLVSDSTGETTQGVVRACLAQFEGVEVNQQIWPMVRSGRELDNVLKGIRENPGAVMFTLVNEATRSALQQECMTLNVPCISVIDPVIEGLAKYFHQTQSGRPGGQHMLNADYFDRIEAMNFVMSHDDGQSAWNLQDADIVLIGVSRTSKTPTSIYLANHWGIKSANVPFVPELPLPPEVLELDGPFCVGLTAAPDRLVQIRRNRLLSLHQEDESDYIDPDVVKREIADARKLFAKQKWPVIDVTRRSIEETASAIYKLYSQQNDKPADAG
jgi:[pyruvate, water dikinase]-phosphate phosphotransferase / [pyruvate, water dikinase] kinase